MSFTLELIAPFLIRLLALGDTPIQALRKLPCSPSASLVFDRSTDSSVYYSPIPLSAMFFAKLAAVTAVLPVLLSSSVAVRAQATDPYANWQYLYADSFENSAGQVIAQQWWLSPNQNRQNNQLMFTLLARRSPIGDNGTAAALFGYIANCDGMMYSIESMQFLDTNDQILTSQSTQRAMEAANPESQFYSVLDGLCRGAY